MSDPNLTDKFVENINNAFKKTKIFEKMETTYFCINSFIVISSIIGLKDTLFFKILIFS